MVLHSSRYLWIVCFVFLTFCCVAQAFIFACFCRGEPYTSSECIALCNQRFGTVQDGERTQFITIGLLNESKTKCFCRITIGFIQFLERKELNPNCYSGLFCVGAWLANLWLQKHDIKVNYAPKRPKAEVQEVIPGVFVPQELEDDGKQKDKPEDAQAPRLGPMSYITGVPSYLWSKVPGKKTKREKLPSTPSMPQWQWVDVSIPSVPEFRERLPSLQSVKDMVPSLQDLRNKVPTFQDVREKTPTFKGLREKAPTFKGIMERAPTIKNPFRSKDKKPEETTTTG